MHKNISFCSLLLWFEAVARFKVLNQSLSCHRSKGTRPSAPKIGDDFTIYLHGIFSQVARNEGERKKLKIISCYLKSLPDKQEQQPKFNLGPFFIFERVWAWSRAEFYVTWKFLTFLLIYTSFHIKKPNPIITICINMGLQNRKAALIFHWITQRRGPNRGIKRSGEINDIRH